VSLRELVTTHHAVSRRAAERSLEGYLRRVVIDSRPEPRPFGVVAEGWQWEDACTIIPALEDVAGVRGGYDGPRSIWYTRPRGHDKTNSLGRYLNWLLGFSRKALRMSYAAADSDQAQLVVDAMQAEAALNPWLRGIYHGRRRVSGPGGTLKILTADAPSSFGLTDDVVVCDEITHWPKRDLYDVLWSGRAKRPGSVFFILSNAGVRQSWQHDVHEKARADPLWLVSDTPEGVHLASWMTPAVRDSIRRLLPRGLARRVLDNRWIDAAEEADFLNREEVESCEVLGKLLGLLYRSVGVPGVRYVAGIDYGPKRDRTALSVVHLGDNSVVVLDRLDVWQGSPEEPIAIRRVEDWIREVNASFNRPDLVIDPYQMEGTCQEFESNQVVERFEARGGKRTYEMAETLRTLVTNNRLAVYPGAGSLVVDGRVETLVDELLGLVLRPTPYGYRFDHEANFHDDRAVAVGMACLRLLRMDPSGPGVLPGKVEQRAAQQLVLGGRKGQRGFGGRGLWGT
jgi:hypothetical protein